MRRRTLFGGWEQPVPPPVPYLSVSPTTKNVAYGSGSFSLNITTNGNWTLTCSSPYLSFDKTSGSGDDVVNVTYQAVTAGFSATINLSLPTGETASCSFRESAYVPPTPTKEENYLRVKKYSSEQKAFRVDADYAPTSNLSCKVTITRQSSSGDIKEQISFTFPSGYTTQKVNVSDFVISVDSADSISPTSDTNYNYHIVISNIVVAIEDDLDGISIVEGIVETPNEETDDNLRGDSAE